MMKRTEPMGPEAAAKVAAEMVEFFRGVPADAAFAARRAGLPEVAAAIEAGAAA